MAPTVRRRAHKELLSSSELEHTGHGARYYPLAYPPPLPPPKSDQSKLWTTLKRALRGPCLGVGSVWPVVVLRSMNKPS